MNLRLTLCCKEEAEGKVVTNGFKSVLRICRWILDVQHSSHLNKGLSKIKPNNVYFLSYTHAF